ncbi:hypothetical protein [Caulobacter sp.]|uniref:hypothetical protein n=1 Tax=Caulobacter sp. TaxID=78 RepID=UPI003BAFAFE4
MTSNLGAPPPMPLPSTELIALAIGIQGWLLTLTPANRTHAVGTLRQLVDETVAQTSDGAPLGPPELRAALNRRALEASAWWTQILDEAES